MIIRKGTQADLVSVEQLYNDIHTAEETGQQTIGWIRGVYPTRATAQAALDAKDLFVLGGCQVSSWERPESIKRRWILMQNADGNSQPGMEEVCVFTLW